MNPGRVVDAKEMGKDRYVLICMSFFVVNGKGVPGGRHECVKRGGQVFESRPDTG